MRGTRNSWSVRFWDYHQLGDAKNYSLPQYDGLVIALEPLLEFFVFIKIRAPEVQASSSGAPSLSESSSNESEGEEKVDQSIPNRTRSHLANQTTTTPLTELLQPQQRLQMPITHTDPNDPPPTPQLTNDNSLAGGKTRLRLLEKILGTMASQQYIRGRENY